MVARAALVKPRGSVLGQNEPGRLGSSRTPSPATKDPRLSLLTLPGEDMPEGL